MVVLGSGLTSIDWLEFGDVFDEDVLLPSAMLISDGIADTAVTFMSP